MFGPSRPLPYAFALPLALACVLNANAQEAARPVNKPEAGKPEAAAPKNSYKPSDFALQKGDDAPAVFVPKTPRTVEDQKKVEAVRLYAEARSLEDRRQLSEAIAVLEKALANDPKSMPILRRLSRLSIALGRTEKSVEYSRQVLEVEPDDAETVGRLVDYYKNRRRDPAKAETLLKDVLANPKLAKNSSSAVLIEYQLAILYAGMQRFDQAAASLTKVMDALDGKNGLKFDATDEKRVLGGDEGDTFLQFGAIFVAAKQLENAARAFQHGLNYEKDNPQLSLALAETYMELGRHAEALELVERTLKGPGATRQVYELLIQALTKLKRENEIIPRLEAAAEADPRNGPLQYALADRYRAMGQGDKADALLKRLIDTQPDLQGFTALFASLLKEKKTEELITLLAKVALKLKRDDATSPQIAALIADSAYTDKVLETGLEMLSAKPERLDRAGWFVLVRIATTAKKMDKLVALLRWSLRSQPDAIVSRELARCLLEMNKFDDAEAEIVKLMEKFPDERSPQTLLWLAQIRVRAHKEAAAIEVLNDVLKQMPNDPDATRLLAFALQQQGKADEAIAKLKAVLANDPANVDLTRALAFIYQSANKSAEAIAYLKEVIDRFPNNDELILFARSSLSTVYTQQGDFAKGEAELEILFAKNPENAGVNNDLGYLYTEQGKNLDKAESMIRKAVTEEPENSAYLDSLGWVLFKRGKVKEAIAPLEKAVQLLQMDDSTVHEHLGDVYFAAKDRTKAKASWEKAEKIAEAAKPPDKRLAEIRKKLESLKKLETGPSTANGNNP